MRKFKEKWGEKIELENEETGKYSRQDQGIFIN